MVAGLSDFLRLSTDNPGSGWVATNSVGGMSWFLGCIVGNELGIKLNWTGLTLYWILVVASGCSIPG